MAAECCCCHHRAGDHCEGLPGLLVGQGSGFWNCYFNSVWAQGATNRCTNYVFTCIQRKLKMFGQQCNQTRSHEFFSTTFQHLILVNRAMSSSSHVHKKRERLEAGPKEESCFPMFFQIIFIQSRTEVYAGEPHGGSSSARPQPPDFDSLFISVKFIRCVML